MEEQELLTVAFGNYSTLIAAQWANGTSYYDVHHHTLYHECRRDGLYAGVSSTAPGGGGMCRVPRLLMFDAPHVSVMKELTEVEAQMATGEGDPTATASEYADPSSLFLNPQTALTDEEKQLDRLVRYAERKWKDGYTDTIEEGEGDEGEEEFSTVDAANGERHSPTASPKALFRSKDRYVPWWRYIQTGLRRGSVTNLSPTTPEDGEVPTMHSFGYGLRYANSGAGEVESFLDQMRCQMELADHCQGLNTYIDGDTMFGGLAANVLEHFWEDYGTKLPATLFATFNPLPSAFTDPAVAEDIPFAKRRREECALNRLLATRFLSAHPSAVYVPVELAHWDRFFAEDHCPWLENDTATAQYIAAITDTALYGMRDGIPSGNDAKGRVSYPAYPMQQWSATIQPLPSLPISALLGTLPVNVNRLVQQHDQDVFAELLSRRKLEAEPNTTRYELWELLQSLPLLPDTVNPLPKQNPHRFHSLTHPFTSSPQSESGRVLGSAVTLRGAAALESRVYPTNEALLRYGLPLRSNHFLPLLTRSEYPVSSTFPSVLLGASRAKEGEEEVATHQVESVATGSHVVTSFSTATMLRDIISAAEPLVRHRPLQPYSHYHLERDEWMEVVEGLKEIYDNYRHEDYIEEGEDEDNDW